MLQLLEMMKIELQKQTETITQNITDTLMRTVDEKMQPIIEENKYLKSEVEILSKKIKYLEDGNRKNNIILHGVKETEDNYEGLYEIIKDKLQLMNVQIEKSEINKYHRLGKKQDANKIRPILISFTSHNRKAEIMRNKIKMPPNTYLTEDFSKETLEMRRNLQQQLKQEREKGNDAFIRNNKIITREKSESEKRKREISKSPQCLYKPPSRQVDSNILAPPKMQKTDAFAYMRARSISLAEKHSKQDKA